MPENIQDFNALQIEKSKQLLFDDTHLYQATNGDICYTIDVYYHGTHTVVGIDRIALPNSLIDTISLRLDKPSMDYMPQYFAFYEGPIVVAAVQQLNEQFTKPNIIIVDGHGIAHPRKFGLACYVGLALDTPCFGIAKSALLPYDKETLPPEKNSSVPLQLDDETLGVAMRLQQNTNPVFISAGHKIALSTCIEIIKNNTSLYKWPDVMRRADAGSKVEL
jgi:deoxyribonuclease V